MTGWIQPRFGRNGLTRATFARREHRGNLRCLFGRDYDAPVSATASIHGSVRTTRGFRVTVRPQYLPQQSNPEGAAADDSPGPPKFTFGYRIRIENGSSASARLLSRRWSIVDADGDRNEVLGEGVVGQQPDLAPGESFDYASYCPIQTPWGTMEGAFKMLGEDGEAFDIEVGRFYLVADGVGGAS